MITVPGTYENGQIHLETPIKSTRKKIAVIVVFPEQAFYDKPKRINLIEFND